MGILERLFGRWPSNENTQHAAQAAGRSSSAAALNDQWSRFFSIIPMEESAEGALKAFVPMWPKEIDPEVFSSLKLDALVNRIRRYQNMKYPLRSPYVDSADLPPNPPIRWLMGKSVEHLR